MIRDWDPKALANERIKTLQYLQLILPPLKQTSMMPSATLGPLMKALSLPGCRGLAATLLQYLDQETIQAICEAYPQLSHSHFFIHLVKNSNFLNNHINKTDRSLYFAFYAEEQYHKIEISQIASIAQEGSPVFLNYGQRFDDIFSMLKDQVPLEQQEIQTMKNLLADPDLPLPKLKRQTQGMFCSSPFQLFLVDCTFQQEENEDFYCFQQFRDFFSLEKEEEYLKQFINILKQKSSNTSELRKIMKIRYTPFQVSCTNFNEFLIPNNQLHNFIVGLFALTDALVQSTHAYISLINDPLHRLVELLLRYSIFRNYVLAVQEYLAFAFRMYENVYHDSIEQDMKKPKYRFWRPALTKWFLRMDYLHSQGTQVYMHCLTKLRNKNLQRNLQQLCQTDQSRYSKLLSSVELNNFQYELSSGIFGDQHGSGSEVQSFFESNPQNYEILIMEFNEYLVDVSVNEQTVHWCGHSNHQVQQPYTRYQDKLINTNNNYLSSFLDKTTFSPELRQQILKIDFEYLVYLHIKNRTLKNILHHVNIHQNLQGVLEVRCDFYEADRKLQYFNAKALILASVDQQQRPFYSIPPLCPPDKLIDMLDTNDSSNNSEQEIYEYNSQSETEEAPLAPKHDLNRPVEHFKDEQPEESQEQTIKKLPFATKKIFAEDFVLEQSSLMLAKPMSQL